MYIAMNRFKVVKGSEEQFEAVWKNRDSQLNEVPGFVEFRMLRGPETDTHTLYASHTLWRDRASFVGWTKSEQFRNAHAKAGSNDSLYDGHPQFEGFETVQIMQNPDA